MIVHIVGALSALDALYWVRSSQGAIAWGIALIIFPYGALPFYWLFGHHRFRGYKELLRKFALAKSVELSAHRERFRGFYAPTVPLEPSVELALERIAESEFTGQNQVLLLVDGAQTFDAIKAAMRGAKRYIFLEYYIVRDDQLGNEIKTILLDRVKQGVRVIFIYDEFGSDSLSDAYIDELTSAGADVRPFGTRQGGWRNTFQLNLRNHRKIAIIDGQTAFVGGHNIGDEYLGQNPTFGAWRDTSVQISGPAVVSIQGTFLCDWYWASQKPPSLEWVSPPEAGQMRVLPIATGPIEDESRCLLALLQAIQSAKSRVWIASPYFVPDESVLATLKLAALRGVDVRILLPDKPDEYLVWLASFSYVPELTHLGVRVFRYTHGFLHEKVLLIDDVLSAVGTANIDNRSFFLNFEIMLYVANKEFATEVSKMFERDFMNSTEEKLCAFQALPLYRRLGAKFARLFAPVL